jgi:hypothetical protein
MGLFVDEDLNWSGESAADTGIMAPVGRVFNILSFPDE